MNLILFLAFLLDLPTKATTTLRARLTYKITVNRVILLVCNNIPR